MKLYGGLRVLGAPTCVVVLWSASEYSDSSVCNGEGMLRQVNQGNRALPKSRQTSEAVLPVHSISCNWKSGLRSLRHFWVTAANARAIESLGESSVKSSQLTK